MYLQWSSNLGETTTWQISFTKLGDQMQPAMEWRDDSDIIGRWGFKKPTQGISLWSMGVSINRIERTPGYKLLFGHGFVGDAEINFINFSKKNYWGHHIAGGLHPRNYICGPYWGMPREIWGFWCHRIILCGGQGIDPRFLLREPSAQPRVLWCFHEPNHRDWATRTFSTAEANGVFSPE